MRNDGRRQSFCFEFDEKKWKFREMIQTDLSKKSMLFKITLDVSKVETFSQMKRNKLLFRIPLVSSFHDYTMKKYIEKKFRIFHTQLQ